MISAVNGVRSIILRNWDIYNLASKYIRTVNFFSNSNFIEKPHNLSNFTWPDLWGLLFSTTIFIADYIYFLYIGRFPRQPFSLQLPPQPLF